MSELTIIGGGLAGSEAAWQAAERGLDVRLYEMRPQVPTGAHETGDLAELVCSNSLGSNLPDRASGLLKNEVRRLGSMLLECAEAAALPAGAALAVDRGVFARLVTERIRIAPAHPNHPRGSDGDPVHARHHRLGAADLGAAVRIPGGAQRRGASVFLRRHRAHRRGGLDQHGDRLPRLAL